MLVELALDEGVEATSPLGVGGSSPLGLSPVVVLLLGDWLPVDEAVSTELGVAASTRVVDDVVVVLLLGDWLPVDEAVSTELRVSALRAFEGPELTADTPFDGLEPVLAILFDDVLIALSARVSCGDALTAPRLGACSTEARASATIAGLSPAPFVLATLAGEVVDSVAPEGGVANCEAVFAGASVV